MLLKKTVEVPVRVKGNNFIVKGAWALPLILGTTSVTGNLGIYKIKKVNRNYFVPIEVVKERIDILEDRVKDLNCKINLMKLVLKSK